MIKTHKELASHIAGKKIMLMNSLGKDSILCLDWLHNYAQPAEINSFSMKFMASHPDDQKYIGYLKKRYPKASWFAEYNPLEISKILLGFYQHPTDVYSEWNHFEFDTLDYDKFVEDWRVKLDCDFVCFGESRYESFARATQFHKRGIVQDKAIFPLGMMDKQQVFDLIKTTGIFFCKAYSAIFLTHKLFHYSSFLEFRYIMR